MRYFFLVFILAASSIKAQTMQSTREDANELMTHALGFAEQQLENYGEFFPFGIAMKPNGEIVLVAGHDGTERPPSQDVIDLLNAGFKNGAISGEYKATALTYNVRITLPNTGQPSDALNVALDHLNDYSALVFLPYSISDGQISYGELFAQKGENGIFGASAN